MSYETSEEDIDPAAPGLGEYRLAQLKRDLALSTVQRLLEAEESLRLTFVRSGGELPQGGRYFDSYADFLDFKYSRNLGALVDE